MKFRIMLAVLLLSFAGAVSAQTTTSTSSSSASAGSPVNTVTVNGKGSDDGERRVSSAASFSLSVSNLTCGAQAGLGAQGIGFGFSGAMSYEFEHCVMIQDAITLHSLGHYKAAHARMCASAANRAAFKLAGDPACKDYSGTVDLGSKAKPVKAQGGVVHSKDYGRK